MWAGCTRDIHLRTEGTFIFNLDLKRKKEVIKYLLLLLGLCRWCCVLPNRERGWHRMLAAPPATVGTWKAGPGSSCLSLRWHPCVPFGQCGMVFHCLLTSPSPDSHLLIAWTSSNEAHLSAVPAPRSTHVHTSAPAYHLLWQITRPLFSSILLGCENLPSLHTSKYLFKQSSHFHAQELWKTSPYIFLFGPCVHHGLIFNSSGSLLQKLMELSA